MEKKLGAATTYAERAIIQALKNDFRGASGKSMSKKQMATTRERQFIAAECRHLYVMGRRVRISENGVKKKWWGDGWSTDRGVKGNLQRGRRAAAQ